MPTAIEQVEASWTNLLAALEGIDEARMTETDAVGVWSIKDLVAHIAYWDGRAIGSIERSLSGEPEPPENNVDFEITNQKVHAERADWTIEQAFDEFHGTHGRLIAALHMAPEIDPDQIKEDTYEHYDEHIDDIRAWRERTGA